MDRPIWLNDELEIIKLLAELLKRAYVTLDTRSATSAITLKKRSFKRDQQGEISWFNLKSLATNKIIIIENENPNEMEYQWVRARVSLPLSNSEIIRVWLNQAPNISIEWRNAVYDFCKKEAFCSRNINWDILAKSPLSFSGKSSQEIIKNLIELFQENNGQLTLRELSARYFCGDSKFLDSRKEWLQLVDPSFSFIERKVLVNFYLSEKTSKILFVENLDTYHRLMNLAFINSTGFSLVYAAGFLSSAARIRDANCVSLHQSIGSNICPENFINWWVDKDNNEIPVFFWGDFDFSAMTILKALRIKFKNAQLWPPGYQLMQQKVMDGLAHNDLHRNKTNQNDPVSTGCVYADENILPILRKTNACYDQEAISLESLTMLINKIQ